MLHRINRRSATKAILAVAASGSLLPQTVFSHPASKPSNDDDPVIARVLNTQIRSSQKKDLGRIVFSTLLTQYAKDRGLSASEEEIRQARLKIFASASADAPGRELRSPESGYLTKMESEMARDLIVASKRNLALFETYGGRVIFQQMGPEPIDAYRAFLEEQKRLGAFEIIDKSLEPGFWSYFTSEKHTFISSTKKEGEEILRTPLWERK
jgi:hypothetical protein